MLIRTLLALFVATFTLRAGADLPEDLRGTWVVDAEATVAEMRQSPDWNADAEKTMPMIMTFMGRMSMTVDAATLSMSDGKKEKRMVPTEISRDGDATVLSIQDGQKIITLSATLDTKKRLRLSSGGRGDMDSMVWKRGTPDTTGDSIAAAMADLMVATISDGGTSGRRPNAPATARTNATEPTDGDTPAFESKWGKLVIHRLGDDVLAAINTIPEKDRARVMIDKDADQNAVDRIGEITGIEQLTIGSKTATSIEGVRGLSSLKQLRLQHMDASKETPIDLGPLAGLRQLEELDCLAARVTNTAALAGLPALKRIKFYMSHVESIDFAKQTPGIEDLNLYGYKHSFPDYTPLLALNRLKILNIYMNTTATDEKLAPLTALAALEEISMSNCRKVTTLSFLSGSGGLKEVDAGWCTKLTDLSALAGMAQLVDVDLKDCAATDFTPLSGKAALQILDLSGTAFDDLALISASSDLRSLMIHDTPITDLSPLGVFPKLRRVVVPIDTDDAEIEALKATHPDLRVSKKK